MKSNEDKLIELLNLKDYKSKIKLYCQNCKFPTQIVAQEQNKPYISKILIIEK